MSITADVSELNNLKIELKRLSTQSKHIRKQAKIVENRIIQYLHEKDQPGVKYHGQTIKLENKNQRLPKKKVDKETDAAKILADYGIPDPMKTLKDILNAHHGDTIQVPKLKIKPIK